MITVDLYECTDAYLILCTVMLGGGPLDSGCGKFCP